MSWGAAALALAVAGSAPAHAGDPAPTTGELVVTVEVFDGTTPTGVQVTLTSPVDPRPHLAGVDPGDGKARLDLLLPGTYDVVVAGEGYVSTRTEVVIVAGRRARLEVDLNIQPDPPRPRRRCLFWRRGV